MKKALLALLLAAGAPHVSFALQIGLTVWNETCGHANGAMEVNVMIGQWPYTYAWSNGSIEGTITDLTPGWYTVTVTDALGQVAVDSAEVLAVPYLQWPYSMTTPQGGLFGCGGCNAGLHLPDSPMDLGWHNVEGFFAVSPAAFDSFPGFGWLFGPYCANDYPQLTITDSTGCMGTVTLNTLNVSYGSPMALLDVQGACLGANGSLTIDVFSGAGIVDQINVTVYNDAWTEVGGCTACGWPEVYTFEGLAAGDHHIVRTEYYYDPYGMSCPPETLNVTVPDLGPFCGQVYGSLFFDHDQDCTQDANDEAMPYRVMEITPGPEYVITNAAGTFSRNLTYGSYTLDQQTGTALIQLCPAQDPIPFTISAGSPLVSIAIADSSAIPFDLALFGAQGPTRVGFDASYHLDVRNLSGALSGPITLAFVIDPELTYVSASPSPTIIAGNTLTWDLPALGAFGSTDIHIALNVPANINLLGTDVTCTASVSNSVSETTLANNAIALTSTITAAVDPNDKMVRTSSGTSATQYFIGTDAWLDYTVRFQNTGTDTAFTVVIVDTLPAALDPLSFEPGAASHPYDVAMSGDGIVAFTFASILLPDSNVNEPASHGLIGFRVKLDQPELPGTVVSNAADIFFDFNPPIRTNDAVVITEVSTSVGEGAVDAWALAPNPAEDHVRIIGPQEQGASYRLLANDGRLLQAGLLGDGRIGTGALANGHYLVHVSNAKGTKVLQFVKR
ncbi:MAG: hypothetical protein IPK70_12995 [Flavobacteriales bacterium]|jgi:hypothetical protein|nr:hypothetical protein [Flavobacteriales bacterium]